MISYNFKLIIFSIILGTLSLIYNKDCDGIYKNINFRNILLPTRFRSLGELLHESTTNYIRENNELREYGNMNEKKYNKNKYPNDDAKRKQNILEVTEKENIGTPNLKKYSKGAHDKEKEAESNISSRSLKYLEMQRKLYNNFYVKTEIHFEIFSDKSNDKFCAYAKKQKMCNQLHTNNKLDVKYTDNFKNAYVGGAGVCSLSCTAAGISGVHAGATAAAKSLLGAKCTADLLTKLTNFLFGVNLFSESAIKSAAASSGISAVTSTSTGAATAASGAAWASFIPYGITIYVIVVVTIILILLYVSLPKRRTNTWKH